ncbi:hypothetical protein [Actinomyces oris]|uniref:hypothetical protein n=1 Tax=Actinomyces oris TaxID=544580 RepID=UPI0015BC4BD4|nr:hypothetical protein [Actinomyces oris]
MSASYSWLGLSPMVWSLISVGIAVWRFYVMASASVPRVPGTPDLGAASPAGKEALA